MIFDAHGDILTDMYRCGKKGQDNSFKDRHLENYKKGNITHSIFVNWTNPATENTNEFNEIFEYSLKEIHSNLDVFHIIKNPSDIDESTNQGKIGVILGIEGIKYLEDVNQLRELYKKGVRHASLTWNDVNKYAGGLSSEKQGLTLLGKEVLDEMENLGIIIDLAHSNPRTFDEILTHTKGPIIISHGNSKTMCDHIRNYTDEQLLKIKERDGVIGVCSIMPFISNDPENQTVTYMAKHIDYIVKLIGINHVGLGFDMCYYLYDDIRDNRLEGLKTMADTENLFIALRDLGYSEEDINKIKYENFFRIVKSVLK